MLVLLICVQSYIPDFLQWLGKETGGGVAEWFRALDLKSGGPRFKSSTLSLNWICFLVVPSSTPPLRIVNSQLVCLPPVGVFNNLCSICSICLFVYSVPN